MSWFYANEGQQVGPVTEAAWDALIQSGKINGETMVWRDGLDAWKPYREISGGTAGLAADLPSGVCSQCGTRVPPDELILLDGKPVCAACKPAALQRIKEGLTLTGTQVYGGFWIRFAAKVIDGIIVAIVQAILIAGLFAVFGPNSANGSENLLIKFMPSLIGLVGNAVYIVFFLGKFSATPGKMICGLKVIRPDGRPLTYGRAFGRWGGELVNAFTFSIGYVIAAFDEEKRGLHDRIADTRVVKA